MSDLFLSQNSPPSDQVVIAQTLAWLKTVVVGCNFCPFASREIQRGSIHFEVIRSAVPETCLEAVLRECKRLDEDVAIETTLLLFPGAFPEFDDFLGLLELGENLLFDQDYEGIYQIASFHEAYCFADAPAGDPANFTNRSLYPMLHLLRESSLDRALESYPDPEGIPERNIAFARRKGLAYMQLLREACLETMS
ncbi:MAG: DUF1415 domain-containing protein [Saprospiraceae bacterium]|nr:DUF1415 domain-containing protein [Saprospiraceae bacterium]